MRLLMMGTGPFAVPTLHALLESHHEVTGLITRPLKSARGRKAIHNPMLEAAEARELPVEMPIDINSPEGHQAITRFQPDLLVVCDYGQILSRDTLGLSPLGGINLHGSLLPRYRGAAPVNWAIMAGDRITGTSVIHMTPQLDGGPLLARCELEINDQENAQDLEQRLAQAGIAPVLESLELLESWDGQGALGQPQEADQVTQARRLRKSDGRLDWTLPARELHNRVRGLQPWPGTYTHWLRPGASPLRLIIVRTSIETILENPGNGDDPSSQQPGQVIACRPDGLVVATGSELLCLQEIQPAGRRAMQVDAFLRGYPVSPGDRFGDEHLA